VKSKRWPWYLLLIIILLAAVIVFFPYSSLNDYQKQGRLNLAGLKEQVDVLRDEKGMAYIYAKNLPDAIMTQGFVTAQDRLFQMHLNRLLDPHTTDQIPSFVNGEKIAWWFSDKAIKAHTKSTLTLTP
jgi:acyl-homoserine lactone acylase PvdQ